MFCFRLTIVKYLTKIKVAWVDLNLQITRKVNDGSVTSLKDLSHLYPLKHKCIVWSLVGGYIP